MAAVAVVMLWLSMWNRCCPRARSRQRVEGEKSGFDLLEGDDQQIALAELVPQHAQALDPGGVGKSWRERWRCG
jgi:hypothetical protein